MTATVLPEICCFPHYSVSSHTGQNGDAPLCWWCTGLLMVIQSLFEKHYWYLCGQGRDINMQPVSQVSVTVHK